MKLVHGLTEPIRDCDHEPENAHLWPIRIHRIRPWRNFKEILHGWHLWFYGPSGGRCLYVYAKKAA